MAALSSLQIVLMALLACSLVISAVRMSRLAGRYGRSRRAWFFITLFLTAIPAAVVFWADHARSVSASGSLESFRRRSARRSPGRDEQKSLAPVRCPHCGTVIAPAEQPPGQSQCPHCGMKIEEDFFA